MILLITAGRALLLAFQFREAVRLLFGLQPPQLFEAVLVLLPRLLGLPRPFLLLACEGLRVSLSTCASQKT
jgi:hypothetical protein